MRRTARCETASEQKREETASEQKREQKREETATEQRRRMSRRERRRDDFGTKWKVVKLSHAIITNKEFGIESPSPLSFSHNHQSNGFRIGFQGCELGDVNTPKELLEGVQAME
ncbi:hypothetical protein Syun_017644 [Stephania yunnanensis]|uniref:Uncharacterized protein n=1 Tax=Stephania yunnanensis TaxID=152371 RepID=A0AAP0J6Y0_9MAGN